MNNGMMMLVLVFGLLWLTNQKPTVKPETWIGGSQAAQMTLEQEIGF